MAIVRITNDVVRAIVANVKTLYASDFAAIPAVPKRLSTTLADALYEYVLPPVIEEQLDAIMPPWMRLSLAQYELQIGRHRFECITRTHRFYWGHREYKIYNVPGVPVFEINGSSFKLSEGNGVNFDRSQMHPELRDVFETIDANLEASQKYVSELTEAEDKMKAFLLQHTTLQSALKAFGPALWDLVPTATKVQFEKPVVRNTGGAKGAKPEVEGVDVTDVIGRIAAKRLGMED